MVQSNYIPWKGYFDLIGSVDEFIIYDDMQYTRRDWRNRNKIKTPTGTQWLTVPVQAKGKYYQKIRDVEIVDGAWKTDHWNALTHNYRRAIHFDRVAEILDPIYLKMKHGKLSGLNRILIETICTYLGINTTISNSWDFAAMGDKNERLVSLCKQASASEYISGPAAKNYLDEELFAQAGIKVTWFDYSGYPEYPQLWGDFEHHVTVLDVLFNCGPDSLHYMKTEPFQDKVTPI